MAEFGFEGGPCAGKSSIVRVLPLLLPQANLHIYSDPREQYMPAQDQHTWDTAGIDTAGTTARTDIWLAATAKRTTDLQAAHPEHHTLTDHTALLPHALFSTINTMFNGLIVLDTDYARQETTKAFEIGKVSQPDVLFIVTSADGTTHVRRTNARTDKRMPPPLDSFEFASGFSDASMQLATELLPQTRIVRVLSHDDDLDPNGPTMQQILPIIESFVG
jgi:hypothetical protein